VAEAREMSGKDELIFSKEALMRTQAGKDIIEREYCKARATSSSTTTRKRQSRNFLVLYSGSPCPCIRP